MSNTMNIYGFKKNFKTAPLIVQLHKSEMDLFDIINNFSFHNKKNNFQTYLDTVVRQISHSNQIFVKSNKIANFYKLDPKEYNALVKNDLMNSYQKVNTDNYNYVNIINFSDKKITDNLKISDRVANFRLRKLTFYLKNINPIS